MILKSPARPPQLPVILQRRSTDEYIPPPQSGPVRRAVERVRAYGPENAARLSLPISEYWRGRQGTAAALRAIDEAWGGGFYNIPLEAEMDAAAADAALGGDQLVIDVQTHYIADRPANAIWNDFLLKLGEFVAPDRFKGLYELVTGQEAAGYSFAEYLRCVFLESETAVAVLTSGPGYQGRHETRMLTSPELWGTKELFDRLAGTGRLINHIVIHPIVPGEIEGMDSLAEWCQPAGWKFYTHYGNEGVGSWMLDDEQHGLPFLNKARETGVRMVSGHKGLAQRVDPTGWNGPSSPRDVGPVAKVFPDITFLVYHSGYELRIGHREEGPYNPDPATINGTDRFIKTLEEAGIGPGGNVYAELGTTWFNLIAHPHEASHVIGKLMLALGEDNIVWGSDSIWYGPTQPLIDSFRAFQIPEEFRHRYGYPELTATAKEKILGLNAARLYGIDPDQARAAARNDDLAWVKLALEEYSAKGTPTIA